MMPRKFLSAASFAAAVVIGMAAAEAASCPTVPTGAIPQICPNGFVNPVKLAKWFYYANPCVGSQFTSEDDLLQALQNSTGQTKARQTALDDVVQTFQTAVNGPANKLSPSVPRSQFSAANYLAGKAPSVTIACAAAQPPSEAAAAQPSAAPTVGTAPPSPTPSSGTTLGPSKPVQFATPSAAKAAASTANSGPVPSSSLAWLQNIRVRDNSDDLLVDPKTQAFSGVSGASVSFSDNGTSHTITNALEGALGFDFNQRPTADLFYDVIPYIAVDRSITTVSGKQSSSSRENVSTGVNAALTTATIIDQRAIDNQLSVNAFHLWDDIGDAQLNEARIVDTPYIPGIVNSYISAFPWSENDALMLIADVRADLGYYSDRGMKPATNPDFTQFGGRVGFDLNLQSLSSDLTVTQIAMHQFARLRNDINLFSATWTYNLFGNKNFGLKANYQNGNQEATAQRIQQWTISLAVKF